MKTKENKIGIISALSSMDYEKVSLFLGNYDPIPVNEIDEQRIENILQKVRKKVMVQNAVKKLRKRRLVLAAIVAALLTFMVASAAIGIAMFGSHSSKSNNMFSSLSTSQNDKHQLFYDTFESFDELKKWADAEGSDTSCVKWFAKNGVPIVTSLSGVNDCRFGLYYNSLEVITDDEDTGNGYMVYLLDKEYADVYTACSEVGIDIRASYGEGEYAEGQVTVNGEICEGLKTVGESGDGFYRYYILHGKALFLINAENDEKVSSLTVEYKKL